MISFTGNRTTTARVVHSDPIGTGMFLTTWTVALELDKPGDVWMVKPPPPGWSKTSEQKRAGRSLLQVPTGTPIKRVGGDVPVQAISPVPLHIRVFTHPTFR